jgi:hypothetical protein
MKIAAGKTLEKRRETGDIRKDRRREIVDGTPLPGVPRSNISRLS